MKKFTADFETAVWKDNETWVWAWAVCEIGNEENLQIGNNIAEKKRTVHFIFIT